jgi:hypothetical protein
MDLTPNDIDVILSPTNPVDIVLSGSNVTVTLNTQSSVLELTPPTNELVTLLAPILRGEQGPVGPAGPTGTITGSAVASVNMSTGTPVYINKTNGQLYPASNLIGTSSMVVGLLLQSVSSGMVGTYDRESVTLSDWTLIIGSTQLMIGQTYFLSLNGTLSTLTPSTGTNTRIGVALTPTTLGINPSIFPIML